MKQIIIILFLVLTCLAVKAQPADGKIIIGGNLGYSLSDESTTIGGMTQEVNRINYSVLPMIGFFLGNKSVIGSNIGISGWSNKWGNYNETKSTSIQYILSPFFRYYLISKTGGLFAEAALPIGLERYKGTSTLYDPDHTLFRASASISTGVYYCITPWLLIEAKLGFASSTASVDISDDEQTGVKFDYTFRINPSNISFGAIFMF